MIGRILVAALLAIVLVACDDNDDPPPDPCDTDHEKAVVLIGDSLSLAILPDGSGGVRMQWSADIARDLGSDQVVNEAIGGQTSVSWARSLYDLRRIADVDARQVSILLGSNDAAMTSTRPSTYGRNVEDLAFWALADGASEVILTPPPKVHPFFFGPEVRELLAAYVEEVHRICDVPGDRIACGPPLDELIDVSKHLADGVHFNDEGNAIVYAAMRSKICGLDR
jgi:lysophospholipase L1-like esterase